MNIVVAFTLYKVNNRQLNLQLFKNCTIDYSYIPTLLKVFEKNH